MAELNAWEMERAGYLDPGWQGECRECERYEPCPCGCGWGWCGPDGEHVEGTEEVAECPGARWRG